MLVGEHKGEVEVARVNLHFADEHFSECNQRVRVTRRNVAGADDVEKHFANGVGGHSGKETTAGGSGTSISARGRYVSLEHCYGELRLAQRSGEASKLIPRCRTS